MNQEQYKWVELLTPLVFLVDVNLVNLEDLLMATLPGSIVRCDGTPNECVRVVMSERDEFLGCVAGMVSEEV